MLQRSLALRTLRLISLPTSSFRATRRSVAEMPGKRKRSSLAAAAAAAPPVDDAPPPPSILENVPPAPKVAKRGRKSVPTPLTNGDHNPAILSNGLHVTAPESVLVKTETLPDSPLSEPPEIEQPIEKPKGRKKAAPKTDTATEAVPAMPAKSKEDVDALRDPEAEVDEGADEEEVKEALSRPPPVNSGYLPLPWKGRLGYACLNTYLRESNPPVFSSRTCRIASILEHRYPLQDPDQPEHATKNRPDRSKPMDMELGRRYLENICLANVRDIPKMIRWNERYGIRFLRLSSEMFPFASHEEYGYKLASFAAEALADAGKVIAQYNHRVTTHPGQFTQLGSPRKSVTENAIRDLAYHDEMLSLLKLPEQQNRDAVMILHMGGVFGDKPATLDRFREIYGSLPQSIKNRLVLENDDVSYSVHELLPICEELNIPMVLDFHHHNIIFDETQIREGTADIMSLYPRILATWKRKNITPKMHYSEPCPGAITGRQRRKHRPRVLTLPPCPDTMDLMIEAKDKEQAVFELMRTFKLPGFEKINDIIPYVRNDDNKLAAQESAKAERKLAAKRAKAAKKGQTLDSDGEADDAVKPALIPDEEVGMGGPEGRVYWPPGMEEWLRPKKREVKPKDAAATPAKKAAKVKTAPASAESAVAGTDGVKIEEEDEDSDVNATPATKKAKAMLKQKAKAAAAKVRGKAEAAAVEGEGTGAAGKSKGKKAAVAGGGGRKKKAVLTPSTSDGEGEEPPVEADSSEEGASPVPKKRRAPFMGRRASGRAKKGVSYAEDEMAVDAEE